MDTEGFRANYPTADKFRFYAKPTGWQVLDTSAIRQTIGMPAYYHNPTKLRVDLTAPGCSMYFGQGMGLRVTSTSAPYLSWPDGSVKQNVPTPDVPWVVLSFADRQPPIILGVADGMAAFQVTGRPGDWLVESKNLKGWLRVGLPLGTKAVQANTAHALGELMVDAVKAASLYTAMPPEIASVETNADLQSVTATWTFNRIGAVVPTALFFSKLAGYAPQIQSPIKRIDAPTEEGPLDVCTTRKLVVRFPVKRVPTGRAIAVDPPEEEPQATVSSIDLPGVVGLAFDNLVSTRDREARTSAEATFADFVTQQPVVAEPNTKQKLPYDADGHGLDLCAAHALLMQSTTSTLKPTSEANSLLSSLAWRMDWLSWRLDTNDRSLGRRSAAIASVAAAICPEPDRRLLAGMFQAGLAAERGLATWQRRQGMIAQEPTFLEALPSLRRTLFTAEAVDDDEGRFGQMLLSPLRVFGTSPIRLVRQDGKLVLRWPVVEAKPSILTLASGFPISLAKGSNLDSMKTVQAFGFTEIRYIPELAGTCEAALLLPAWAKPIPPAVAVPSYTESMRG